jgi:hypothetical protein
MTKTFAQIAILPSLGLTACFLSTGQDARGDPTNRTSVLNVQRRVRGDQAKEEATPIPSEAFSLKGCKLAFTLKRPDKRVLTSGYKLYRPADGESEPKHCIESWARAFDQLKQKHLQEGLKLSARCANAENDDLRGFSSENG